MSGFLADVAGMKSCARATDLLLDGTALPFCVVIVAALLRERKIDAIVRFSCIVDRDCSK